MSNPLSPDPSQNLLPSTSFSALNWNPQEPNPAVILQSDLLIGHINQNPNIPALTPNPSDSLLLAQIEGSIATIDPNITLPNDNSFDGLTGEAMDIVKEQLTQFAKVPNFVEKMNLAFGESWDTQAANSLTQDWLNGDFSLIPPVKFVSSAEIGGANGAFASATDTIYLSRELLTGNGANPATVADVLLEEIGHSVDSRLNVADSPGDEGAIFGAVVQGKELSEGELQGLRGEDDRGTVVLGGENTTIEMSQQQWTIRSYSDWRNRTVDWNKPDKTSDQNGNRQDGKDGIYIDWRIGSPFDPPNNLEGGNNPDYFATCGYTKASFEAGGTYKFRVSADDGIVIGVRQVGQSSNQTIITPRSQDGKVQWEIRPWGKEYSWSPTQTGEYYVIFQHCEVTGNAGVDISWEKTGQAYSGSSSSSSFSVPGFTPIKSAKGVNLYGSADKSDYLQVVDLSQGASIKLQTGQRTGDSQKGAAYGGINPQLPLQSIQDAWTGFSSNYSSNAFSISNGAFFAQSWQQYYAHSDTEIAYPLKINDQVFDGYGKNEYTNEKRKLEIWNDQARITDFDNNDINSIKDSSAPMVIVGLKDTADINKDQQIGRTFVGVEDRDNNGTNETVILLNSKEKTQAQATQILKKFGANQVMMLDGSGSSQLIAQGQNFLKGDDRWIPQTIGVVSGS